MPNLDPLFQNPKILILSDENLVVSLQRILAILDPVYIRPLNVADACDKGKKVDLAIVTINLQECGGHQATKRLAEADDELPIIVLAPQNMHTEAMACVHAGARDFLIFPLEQEAVVESVQRACQRRRKFQEKVKKLESLEQPFAELGARKTAMEKGVIGLCLVVMRYKSQQLEAHSLLVMKVAEKFAAFLGWPQEQVDKMRTTAAVHDFGLISLSSESSKIGPNSPPEVLFWKRHPLMSKQMLESVFPEEVFWPAVEYHHAYHDGSGFPSGMPGSRMPLEARFLCLVNDFSRKIRPPFDIKTMSLEDAMIEVMNGSGTLYDNTLVEQFVRFISETDLSRV